LAANAITALTKKMTVQRNAKSDLDRLLKEVLSGKSTKYRLPIAAELSSLVLPAIDEANLIQFLKTPEANVFAHEVAVSVALNEYADSSRSLIQQAEALLLVEAGVSRDTAKVFSKKYCEILAASYDFCIGLLRESAKRELRELANEEKKAGYLKSIAQRTTAIQRQTPESLVEILQFVRSYKQLAHSGNSEVMPAHISDQRGIALDLLYVEPDLLVSTDVRAATQSLSEFRRNIYRDVVLGDPGAGKSTLSQKIMFDLTQPDWDTIGMIPFLVTLRDFQQYKKATRNSIAQYITSIMSEEYQLDSPRGAIEYLLAAGKVLVIFDGLDELLDTHKKREMRTAIEKFSELYATSHVLITSRRIGYREAPLRPEIFKVSSLTSFKESQVIEYTVKWFALDSTLTKNERRTLADNFIGESSSIQDLRENPLMLSLLCNLYRGARSIPRDRADLYERCAMMLFDRWDAQRGIIIKGPLRSDAREALQDIALWLFESPGWINGVPHNRLISQLISFYYPDKYESRVKAKELAEELLALWRGRAWVLTDNGTTSSGETLYGFTHQTFLEYFAAIELAARNPSPQDLWRVLAPRIARAEWDVVAQVAIQSLSKSFRGAANVLISNLLNLAADSPIEARLNLLNFVSGYLDAFAPTPPMCRQVTRACVDMALDAQSTYPQMPDFWVYMNRRRFAIPAGEDLDSDDLLTPLLQVVGTPDEIGEYARDEVAKHLALSMTDSDPRVQGKALILALSYDYLLIVADSYDGQSFAIDCQTVREILKVAGKTNFWIALEAARWGCIDAGQAAQLSGVEILYCTVNSFEHSELAFDIPALAFDLLKDLIETSSTDNLSPATMKALPGIAGAFRKRLLGKTHRIDPSWLQSPDVLADKTLLEPLVVQQSLTRSEPGWYGSDLFDESLTHPFDAELGMRTELPIKKSSNKALTGDYFFGAACMMAAAIELENWNIYDYSEDQIADFRLGVLQPMAPIIICRLLGESYQGSDLRNELSLSASDAQILESWAFHRFSFIR
jgi:NACHT domain